MTDLISSLIGCTFMSASGILMKMIARKSFSLGRIVATPGAIAALERAGDGPAAFLDRHSSGDWGDVDDDDRQLNDKAVVEGTRILSAYRTSQGERFWIITEADRSATTILLPAEY